MVLVDYGEILRYLGYKNNGVDEDTMEKIQDCVSEIQKVTLVPSSVYKTFDIDVSLDNVILRGTTLSLDGADLAKHLKGCDKCSIMAVTLGIEVERRLMRYSKLNLTKAVIMDATASSIVESICDEVQAEISRQAMKEGYYITSRFSPGYGDLSLQHQRGIIRILDAERQLGLTLTDTNLLLPRKSVTAIIGFYKGQRLEGTDYKCVSKCETCNLLDCKYRKVGVNDAKSV